MSGSRQHHSVRDLLVLGGSDVSICPASSGDTQTSLVAALRAAMDVESARPVLTALYFAPSADQSDHSSVIKTDALINGGFHLQEMAARELPLPQARGSSDEGSEEQRVPYLLLHQHLDIDRLCRKASLRVHQHRRTHTVVHAETPGAFGIAMRRIAERRSFPFLASYQANAHRAIETTAAKLLHAVQAGAPSLHQVLSGDIFRELFPFLADEPELLGPLAEILADTKRAADHLGKEHHRLTRQLGRIIFWIGQRLNPYVYDRVEGGRAALRVYQNAGQFGSQVIERYGLPSAFGLSGVDQHVMRGIRLCVRQYLQWFYRSSQLVLITDERDQDSLMEIGVRPEKIRLVSTQSVQLVETMRRICQSADQSRRQDTAQIPHVQSLLDFQWQTRPPGYPQFKAFCSISDLHLADGDSFDRMEALAELYPLLDAKGVNAIVYNGDLGELSASRKKYHAHRNRINWVRQSCLEGLGDEPISPTAVAEIRIAALRDGQLKNWQSEKIVRQMVKAAGRAGLELRINGEHVGILADQHSLPATDLTRASRVRMQEVLTYGNHDEGLVLEAEFPGIESATSLVHYDEEMGAVFTHGHIVGLSRFKSALEECSDNDSILAAFRRENLRAALAKQEVIHDVATLGWRSTERAINSRWLWKHALQPTVSRIVQRLRKHRRASQAKVADSDSPARFWESIVSPADDVARCAQLAASFHSDRTCSWICCYGHSHVPAIEKVQIAHPQTGRLHTKIVVNSGKFHGDFITAVIVNFPEVAIFHWSQRDKAWRMHMHNSLSDDEVAAVLDTHGIEPSPSVRTTKSQQATQLTDRGAVLHEVPTEGDGHITRFAALYPEYLRYGSVCTVLSGPRSQELTLPGGVNYRCSGLRLHYSDVGGLDTFASTSAYFQQIRTVAEEARQLAPLVPNFSAIVSDFGPTLKLAYNEATRRARSERRLNSLPDLFSISHQAALESQQENVPRPDESFLNDLQQRAIDMLRGTISLGFHYESYNSQILLPMIRPEVASLQPKFDGDFVLVYLRGEPPLILELLSRIDLPIHWHVYHRDAKSIEWRAANVCFRPPDRRAFVAEMNHCRGILADAGFGITSEALHLGLPLVCRPVSKHYEQQANAAALRHISDVGLVQDLDSQETSLTIQHTFGDGMRVKQRLQRTGMMGDIEPYCGVAQKVVELVLGKL